MDPFGAEGELINMHNTFHQGQFAQVLDFDTSALSPENKMAARVLKLRAQIAMGQADEVLAQVKGESVQDLEAVAALAQMSLGKTDAAVATVEKLLANNTDNTTVLVLCGTVLQAAGKSDEALNVLGRHLGSLDAVALIVQIHLQLNRTDLALKEVSAARRWAQDSLLVNLAESWVGLRLGGEKYQQAFYVFEELAQAPSTSSVVSLVSQAVSELLLGRTEEAEAVLEQAIQKEPQHAEAIANTIVLSVITGKDPKEYMDTLKKVKPQHHFLTDLEKKSALFDKAAMKYHPNVKT